MQAYEVESLGIDVRRFTSFGVVKVRLLGFTTPSPVPTNSRDSCVGFTGTLCIRSLTPQYISLNSLSSPLLLLIQ